MLFEGYGFVDRLQSNIEAAGLRRPTDIQYRAIPVALRGDDLLAIAQTGTGKTLAFALPVIEMLAREPKGRTEYAPRAMVMVPTHELARQIYTVYAHGKRHGRCSVLLGGWVYDRGAGKGVTRKSRCGGRNAGASS